jgi:hypothetical protein
MVVGTLAYAGMAALGPSLNRRMGRTDSQELRRFEQLNDVLTANVQTQSRPMAAPAGIKEQHADACPSAPVSGGITVALPGANLTGAQGGPLPA